MLPSLQASMDKQRVESCQYCREKHIKCNGKEPCQNCSKIGRRCFRNKKGYRFGKSTKFKSNLGFSSDQTWMQTDHIDDSSYVDLTDEVARASGEQKHPASEEDNGLSVEPHEPQTSRTVLPRPLDPLLEASQQQGRDNDQHGSSVMMDVLPDADISTPNEFTYSDHLPSAAARQYHVSPVAPSSQAHGSVTTPRCHFDTAEILDLAPELSSPITLASPIQHDPLHGPPVASNEAAYLGLQEACLLRHFADNLAPWVSPPCVVLICTVLLLPRSRNALLGVVVLTEIL